MFSHSMSCATNRSNPEINKNILPGLIIEILLDFKESVVEMFGFNN